MKTNIKSLFLLMSLAVTSVISCQDEPMSASQESAGSESAPGRLATVDAQVASIKSAVADVVAVQDGIDLYIEEVVSITSQMLDDIKAIGVKSGSQDEVLASMKSALEIEKAAFAAEAKAMEELVASVKSGADWGKTTLSVFDRQKSMAEAVGSLEYRIEALGEDPSSVVTEKALRDAYDKCLKGRLDALEAGVASWIGEPFGEYFAMAADGAKMSFGISAFSGRLQRQLRDIEGLDAEPETSAMKTSIVNNLETVSELTSVLATVSSEMEKEYRKAISKAVASKGNVDAAAIDEVNEAARVKLMSTGTSITELLDRIAACEAEIADFKARLEAVEGSLGEMLSLIQSITFVSDYSTEKVNAYYTLSSVHNAKFSKPDRVPSETIDLNYLVRPASAAAALASEDIWNSGLEVLGYYAPKIRLSSVSASDMVEFTIENVTADAGTGLVTVSVKNALSENFYFKETGAKLALSVNVGNNDLTTRFVEVVPTDASGTIYIESLKLSSDYIEIDNGKTAKLVADIAPADATDKTLMWSSDNTDIVTVSDDGVLTAIEEGEAVVTVKTRSTDEWGLPMSATCKVMVLPSIKLVGPGYVEEGGTIEIRVESPEYINSDYITWESSNTSFATVEGGVVTGVKKNYDSSTKGYKSVDIICSICMDGVNVTKLTHTIMVVAVQPKSVVINSLADGVNEVTLKLGGDFSLSGSIYPEAAATDGNFRLVYGSYGGGGTDVATVGYDDGYVIARGVGSTTAVARVLSNSAYDFYYPVGKEVSRSVTINVEPYYVETISLPDTFTMNPDQTATLTPTFTSDVSGKTPTYQEVVWESEDESIVVIGEEGKLTALKEGTVKITATTSNPLAVPEGVEPKSDYCMVTVKAPAAAIDAGYYYYKDGTWSKDLNAEKTVIGVVFSTANAVASDTELRSKCPNCFNGLVVALPEYISDHGYVHNQYTAEWLRDNGYTTLQKEDVICGYTNTLAMQAYNVAKGSNYGLMFSSSEGVLSKHTVDSPDNASAWYIPSYAEMKELYTNMSKVNESLSKVGGTEISTGRYWLSSFGVLNDFGDLYIVPFDMNTGNWYSAGTYSEDLPVRVILAF